MEKQPILEIKVYNNRSVELFVNGQKEDHLVSLTLQCGVDMAPELSITKLIVGDK